MLSLLAALAGCGGPSVAQIRAGVLLTARAVRVTSDECAAATEKARVEAQSKPAVERLPILQRTRETAQQCRDAWRSSGLALEAAENALDTADEIGRKRAACAVIDGLTAARLVSSLATALGAPAPAIVQQAAVFAAPIVQLATGADCRKPKQ